jgi:ring-1,2-phenylacetyl-CoA epoxidase subunit PaaC
MTVAQRRSRNEESRSGDVMPLPLFPYVLAHADDALVLGHRLSEWSGKAPMLEEDIALSNLGLDLIGQARLFYTYAGEIEGAGRDEDALAYLRDEHAYANLLLVEQPNGDFAATMVRHLLYAAFMHPYFQAMQQSKDARLAAIAAKAVKEMAYHVRHSAEWVIRLGDGTEESHARAQTALDDLWMYTGEMFDVADGERALVVSGIAPDRTAIKPAWDTTIDRVLAEASRRSLDADRRPRRPARRAPRPPACRDAGAPPRASGGEMVRP